MNDECRMREEDGRGGVRAFIARRPSSPPHPSSFILHPFRHSSFIIHHSRLSSSRGLTLIEVLVVLGILGVAAGLMVPRIGSSLDQRELRESAARFAHTARAARELAVSTRKTCGVEIDLDRGGYGVLVQTDEKGGESLKPIQASWLKAGHWPKTIKVAGFRTSKGAEMTQGTQRVEFRSDGTSSGAYLRLEGPSGACAVLIHAHSGQVLVGEGAEDSFALDQYDLGD